ncbi:MAG: hypothetical protein K6L80_04715 [Agarilytica sp.]
MKILFCTQSESLRMFDTLRGAINKSVPVEKVAYTVADSFTYDKWLVEHPDFENQGHEIMKEWDITSQRHGVPDLDKLAEYERKLDCEAGLFGAIIADRRLFMGPDCATSQDYRRRFSDTELLCILQKALEEIEKLFDTVQPDIMVSFICVTMQDYLAYIFAKARGVRVFNLRPTRVGDRVSFSSILNDPSPEFTDNYHDILASGESTYLPEAQAHIKRVREKHGRYEGVIKPSDRPAMKANISRFRKVGGIISAAKNYLNYRKSTAFNDNHVPDPLRTLLFTALKNPYRARKAQQALAATYIRKDELSKTKYVFFPLHTEPEVSLLVYGRPYVNQIEVIRMLAMSLPIDMVVVVKEHPWMVGKRSLNAYKKMLNIPRVRLADPGMDARDLIISADLISVITGSVALEAAMIGRPVITFGDCPYNLLPNSMVRRCDDPRNLQSIVKESLSSSKTDENALEAYVASVFETSASVNLYSSLLGKKNVHVEHDRTYNDEIQKMADFLLEQVKTDEPSVSQYSANW